MILEIQFLFFSGCPLAEPARENLRKALAKFDITGFQEIDILDDDSPEDLRDWGSPTILVNGLDVTGIPKGNSISCRVYPFEDGVPDVASIVSGLKAASE